MSIAYRRLIHASALIVPVLADATSKSLVLGGLILVTLVYILEELFRLRGTDVPRVTKFTLKMSRPEEGQGFIVRPIYLALGVILALTLFPRSIAYASIFLVAVGDPVAAYVGERFGRRYLGRKSWEGFLVGWIVAFPGTLIFVSPIVGVIGSLVGMLFELSGIFDDNLTIPLGGGIAMILAKMLT